MSKFSIRYPYFVVVCCLITAVVGITSLARMPVDLFPEVKIPIVVVATFYNGMPPEEIETKITGPFERFFTLGSGIDHIESRSLPGVSLIKVFFQPGTPSSEALATISNLAMADLRRLPPGTLPPVILKFDASSMPVCLISLKGEGLTEARLRDLAQYDVRNQVANVQGASVPMPFGGKYRQIMVYVDPLKLQARQLSVMDVVRSVNDSNLILPAGDVVIGPYDYSLYTNSQVDSMGDLNSIPLKSVNGAPVLIGDVGQARDASAIQTSLVRIDGQRSVYIPVLKQGGDSNTIAVVDGIRAAVKDLVDIPKQLVTKVVFDQSVFVKTAIETLIHEGALGMLLTGLMILLFLGNFKATLAVFLSIPLSALATFFVLSLGGSSVNTMVLGGLALAFSRLIDNSVVVLENIFRHMEMGKDPAAAAEVGGKEVALPVLASTLTTAIVFFPVTLLYGVSRFLFSAMALSVVISLFASYVVAMTVVPLFCAKLMKTRDILHHDAPGDVADHDDVFAEAQADLHGDRARRVPPPGPMARFNIGFNRRFHAFLHRYHDSLLLALGRPVRNLSLLLGVAVLLLGLFPAMGFAYFPRTDPGQFVINLKAPTGTEALRTEKLVAQVEDIVRRIVRPQDLDLVLSNIGSTPGFSSLYTPNSASHTAFVQVGLKRGHAVSSYDYMDRVRAALHRELPQASAYFQSGGLVDAVLNLGLPTPIDLQVTGGDLDAVHRVAAELSHRIHALPGVADTLVPQDIDAPSLQVNVDRVKAAAMGLSEKEIVSNVITALNSNAMIAPGYWIDPKSGNAYFLTVQYPENAVRNQVDLKQIPLRSKDGLHDTTLDSVASLKPIVSPTEIDHYQLRKVVDVYVSTAHEDLSRIQAAVRGIVAHTALPEGVRVHLRGSVQSMSASFSSFAIGLVLSTLLVYLILVAQFASFMDPLLILLAIPTGLTGVVLTLLLTGTTLNVMSLMGVVMMVGIVVSNSILIVEFTRRLIRDGRPLREAVVEACQARLRPILMTSLATIIGLIPMALKLGEGSESYAPLARAIVGGLTVSVVTTVFIVPLAYVIAYRGKPAGAGVA
ncbi:MAG: efflux RND transporter permease subunit [Nevskia sp.]|nr:efflux RND transporter permease subunit [Nevskia sp.]